MDKEMKEYIRKQAQKNIIFLGLAHRNNPDLVECYMTAFCSGAAHAETYRRKQKGQDQ